MSDQQITCAECGNLFVFSASEQAFYTERGLASPPKRCKACRQARRASQGDGGGGGGGGGRGGFRDRGPRPSGSGGYGNGGGYRGANGSGNGYGGGGRDGNERPSWGGGQARQNGASRGPGGGPPRGRGSLGNTAPRPGSGFDRGGSNGRSDARPSFAARAGSSGGESSWGTRPHERTSERPNERGERGNDRHSGAPRPARGRGDRPAPAPRETKPNERPPGTRPERPKYDITCAECGTQAQVPFKPLEGRQVFCQPCYRARKGTPEAGAEAGHDNDSGIVE